MTLSRRQIVALAILGCLTLAVTAVGVYGLIIGPKEQSTSPSQAEPSTRPSTAPPPATDETLVEIARTDDAERFAESVARAIFDWDTNMNVMPADLIEHILAFADPTGYETPGLYQDLSGYFPTKDQWSILRDYRTAQSLEISTLGVPESWPAIAAESANEIADGTVAVTITGTRTRTGGWNGEQSAKTYPVEFTMFVSCPESGRCSVLRLSQLGAALH